MGHGGILQKETVGDFLGDNGIHEEGSCAADLLGIGEFGLANLNDGFTDVACCAMLGIDALTLQLDGNGLVGHDGREVLGKAVPDVCDDEPVLQLMLEDAAAIGVVAVGVVNDRSRQNGGLIGRNGLGVPDDVSLDSLNAFTSLYTVGTDVLHGTCSHFTGYEGEVLQSIPTSFGAVLDKGVPLFAGTDTQENLIVVFIADLNASDATVKDGAVVMFADKQEVAAAADVHPSLAVLQEGNELVLQFFDTVILDELIAGGGYAESVMM